VTESNDPAAERAQIRTERVRNILRTAFRDRPSHCVPQNAEKESERRRRRGIERHVRMARNTGKESASARSFETSLCEALRRSNRMESETSEQQRVFRYVSRRGQDFRDELFPVANECREKFQIGRAVRGQSRTCLFDGTLQNGGCAVVEWMSQGGARLNPL
jgi:hypothetical protein